MTSAPAEMSSVEPVIQLERMSYDVPVPTTEPRPVPSPSSPVADLEHSPASEAQVKQEETPVSLAALNITIDKKPSESIFFFKRMTTDGPRFDALMQVGQGELLPGSEEYTVEDSMWEVNDGLYVLRKTGPSFKVLQSIGAARYGGGGSHKAKQNFSLKTCAFLGNRDKFGSLHVLSLCVSGNAFEVVDLCADSNNGAVLSNNGAVLSNPKWLRRVQNIAKLLDLKMGSPYDACGKTASADDVGRWAAGHCEKKLAALALYLTLKFCGHGTGKVTMDTFRILKRSLRRLGISPKFEIHLTRAPCGTSSKPGKCVPFVQRLGHLTGIDFTIHYWEENVILDGTVPPRQKKKALDYAGNSNEQNNNDEDDGHDSEEEDLRVHLADQYPDDWGLVVRNGFDEVDDEVNNDEANEDDPSPHQSSPSPFPQQQISPEAVQGFRDKIRREFTRPKKRPREEVWKPLPPTPADEQQFLKMNSNVYQEREASTSWYFESEAEEDDTAARANLQLQQNRAAKAETKRTRRGKKQNIRKKAAAAAAAAAAASNNIDDSLDAALDAAFINVNAALDAAAINSPPRAQGASVIAGRLGALAHSSQRIG